MPNEGGATVGRIVAILELRRGEFTRDAAASERSLTSLQAQARRTAEAVTQGGAAMGRAGRPVSQLADSTGRLRAAQLSVAASQARLNVVTAQGAIGQEKLRAVQAAVNVAQEKRNALLATGSASAAEMAAADKAVTVAQERYNAALIAGRAATGRLASSEASLIRSQERLAAFRPPADPGGFTRMRHSAVGAIEMVGKLGLALGAFELARKGIEEFKLGNEFTTALNGVQAASQATDAQMTKVRATAIGMGKDLTIPKATAVDAAVAMDDLVRAGVSLDRAMVAARPALLLAAAAQVSIADAARVTGDVMDDFRLPASKATLVANTLAAASNSAGGGLMDLFNGMKFAGPTARTLGVDVTMTSAALVLMAKSGHQGSIGGTAFANMLTRLAPVAKAQKEALAALGVSAWDAQGKFRGLPVVVDQLHKAQERLSPKAFAQDVQVAFGNRARLAVFDFAHGGAAALDVFYRKLKAGDVQAYANTMNRGLSAAGAQIHKQFAAWAIDLNGKVQPALAKAAFSFSNGLPGAIAATQRTLGPLTHEIGDVLVPALKVGVLVLGGTARALTSVGSLMSHHTGTVQVLGTVVAGMWLAWKGYVIAGTAVRAVSTAIDVMTVKAFRGAQAVSGIAAGTTAISGASLALGAVGIALGVAAYAWQKHQAAVAADKEQVESITGAIKADSGALGENTKAAVINALEKKGALVAAQRLGVNLDDLTSATLGNADATGRVSDQLKDYATTAHAAGKAMDLKSLMTVNSAFADVTGNVDKSSAAYRRQQAAAGKSTSITTEQKAALDALTQTTSYTVDAAGNLVEAQTSLGDKVDDTTKSVEKQKTAADLLKASWDALNGVAVSVETSQNAFLDSLDGLTDSVKSNGRSLNQNTAAGRKNREQMVQIIAAAKEQAQATADSVASTDGQTAGLLAGNRALKANEDRLRAQAAKLHLSKSATDALVTSLGQISTVTALPDIKPALSAVQRLQNQIDAIKQGKPVVLGAKSDAGRAEVADLQARINAIAQGKVPGLDADSKAGRAEVSSLQRQINAVKQGRAVKVDADSAAGRAKITELQGRIDAIKQHRPTGLNADPAAARAKIVALQRQINIIRQGAPVGIAADTELAKRRLAALQAEIDGLHGKNVGVNITVNQSVGRTVHDAVNSIPIPHRNTGGGLPEGMSTVGEQGWEVVEKRGNNVQVYSHKDSRKILPQGPSVPAWAAGTKRYMFDGIGYASQLAADNAKVRASRVKPKPIKPVIIPITFAVGNAYGIASVIKGQTRQSVLAMRNLSVAVNDAFRLDGINKKLAASRARLAADKGVAGQFRATVQDNLAGAITPTAYGSVSDLINAYRAGTATNKGFAATEAKAAHNGLGTSLLARLAQDGPDSPLAQVIGSASKGQLGQLNKAYTGFVGSSGAAATVATNAVYGSRLAADQKAVAGYAKQSQATERAMVRAFAQLARVTGLPGKVTVNGKEFVRIMEHAGVIQGIYDDLSRQLTYRR